MVISNSNSKDISEIFRLYDLATVFQKLKFPENQWPVFEHKLISTEILENRQFKLMIDNKIACVWAITYTDKEIWEEHENHLSIYIHRIATNPEFRGNNFTKTIVEWARDFASQQNKQFIRMDTCGENKKLISHYTNCGFKYLGMKKLKNTANLPSHYQNTNVCFFELKL